MAKDRRGGKHGEGISGRGDFGKDTAGQKHHLIEKEWGTKRQFVGSGDKSYVFYSETLGYANYISKFLLGGFENCSVTRIFKKAI